jgi:hypothetical protein
MKRNKLVAWGPTGRGKSYFAKKEMTRWAQEAAEAGGSFIVLSTKADLPRTVLIDPKNEYQQLASEIPSLDRSGAEALQRLVITLSDDALANIEQRVHVEIEHDEERVELTTAGRPANPFEIELARRSLESSQMLLSAVQGEITRRQVHKVAQIAAEAMRAPLVGEQADVTRISEDEVERNLKRAGEGR